MVRDLTTRTTATTMTRKLVHSLGCVTIFPNISGVYTSERSFRGDLVKSDGHRPTIYRAHRYKCKPISVFGKTTPKTGFCAGKRGQIWDEFEGTSALPNPFLGDLDGSPWDSRFPQSICRVARNNVLGALAPENVNLSQFAGELPEAIGMMTDAVLGVLRVYRAIKRGDSSAVKRAFREALDRQTSGKGQGPLLPGRGLKPKSFAKGSTAATFKQFTKAARAARNARNADIRRRLEDIVDDVPRSAADMWLAYSFGWKPLLSDIHGLSESIAKGKGEGSTHTVSRTMTTSGLLTPQTAPAYSFEGGGIQGCTVSVTYGIESALLNQLQGSGLVNPAALAWELLPMSFLIDYLLPIGQFLSLVTGSIGLEFLHGFETRFSRATFVMSRGNFPLKGIEAHWQVNTSGMSRTPLIDFPSPSLIIRSGISPTQAANILALLAK